MLDRGEEKEGISVKTKPKADLYIYKKAQTRGVGEGLKRKRYVDEWDFTYHHSFQN